MSISSISRRDIEEIYGLENWGAGYFSVSRRGHLMVHTQPSQAPGIDIKAIVDTLGERGLYPPLLLRFPQIISSQINQLHEAFARAIAEGGYRGNTAVSSPSRSINGRKLWPKSCAPGVPMITVWRWEANPNSPPPWPYMIIRTRC